MAAGIHDVWLRITPSIMTGRQLGSRRDAPVCRARVQVSRNMRLNVLGLWHHMIDKSADYLPAE
jgi:hypothetical protein